MNKLPFVTIIIPYKNNLDYLFIALKSIFNQSYKNFKILIVYDDEDKSDLSKIKKFLKSKAIKKKLYTLSCYRRTTSYYKRRNAFN